MCFRLGFRPHMNEFMIRRDSNISYDNFMKKCRIYDKYLGLYCIYLEAAKAAKNNFEEAKQICNKFEDEKLKGECSFYIASSLVMNIEENTSEKIGFIMDFCSNISYPSWKSECYYVSADELASIENTPYLKEIADACKESQLAKDYFCFNHVTYLMPLEKVEDFCRLVEPAGKADCYTGLGEFTYDRYFGDNLSLKVEKCDETPDEFRSYCFEGLGYSLWRGHNVSLGLKICNEFPDEFRSYCFEGFGSSIITTNDISLGIERCNEVPDEFRGYCFRGLGCSIGRERNIYLGIKKCNEVPDEFREECFEGFGFSVGSGEDITLEVETCNETPDEFRSYCFEGMSNFIKRYFNYNTSLIIERCNEFPEEFRDSCINIT